MTSDAHINHYRVYLRSRVRPDFFVRAKIFRRLFSLLINLFQFFTIISFYFFTLFINKSRIINFFLVENF